MEAYGWRPMPKKSARNESALLKCLGVVQANLANAEVLTLHTRFLQTLQAIPRDGMNRFQVGNLDKMIAEEQRRIEGLVSSSSPEK